MLTSLIQNEYISSYSYHILWEVFYTPCTEYRKKRIPCRQLSFYVVLLNTDVTLTTNRYAILSCHIQTHTYTYTFPTYIMEEMHLRGGGGVISFLQKYINW